MLSRKIRPARLTTWLFFILALIPASVYAQVEVDTERLEDWFYSRLAWGAVIGLIIGALVGSLSLCRLEFPINTLHINDLARKRFSIWLIVIIIVGGILLLLDAWLMYPFSFASMTFSDALGQVWFNYRTLLVLLAGLATFSLSVAVATRITPGSHCPYAFLPGPRGR